MKFFDTTAGIGASFQTHGRTHTDRRTDRREVGNSYLDKADAEVGIVI